MKRVLSTEQMRGAENSALLLQGISSSDLVVRAGNAVAKAITDRFSGGKVLVIVGKGNNGADGRVIFQALSLNENFSVSLADVFHLPEEKFDIVVDCIFGTGLNREPEGEYAAAIDYINDCGAFVVACDIASGLSADNGTVVGRCVKADLTVAIQNFKLGHFLCDGIDKSGETIVVDIGIGEPQKTPLILDGEDVKRLFCKPLRNVNKGSFKKAAVIGGSKSFSGSAVLAYSALAAFKTGLGYSNIAVPGCVFPAIAGVAPECTVTILKDDGNNFVFDEDSVLPLLKYDALSVGMGMGATEEVYKLVVFLLKNYRGRLIIDADGLNALHLFGADVLREKRDCEVVLTPHVGEFCRLTGKSKQQVLKEGVSAAETFAKSYGVTLVLKSATTIITDGENVYINIKGSPCMAKAGSGDVLSGLLTGILCKGEEVAFSSAAATYIFGTAGESAEKEHGNPFTVTATDLLHSLSSVVTDILGS